MIDATVPPDPPPGPAAERVEGAGEGPVTGPPSGAATAAPPIAAPPAWDPMAEVQTPPSVTGGTGATALASPAPSPSPTTVSDTPNSPALTRAQLLAQRPKPKPRFWRRKLVWTGLFVFVLLLAAVGVAWARLATYTPHSTVRLSVPTVHAAPADSLKLPWPANGEAAFSLSAFGLQGTSPAQNVVPVASLTKMMTAYVILHDYPLADGASGPTITMTLADGVDILGEAAAGDSYIQIQPGLQLTERQLVQGMLVHSANNFADALAVFDSGSVDSFVYRMNNMASSLGLHQSHFADPSGLSQDSTSTPADLILLAQADMAIPAFAEAVAMPSVTLPVGGTVTTFTPLLAGSSGGVDGVVGVKSGYTSEAGGCDVMAYQTTVVGQKVTVLVAVTGQSGANATALSNAGHAALALAQAVTGDLKPLTIAVQGRSVGSVAIRGSMVPVVESSSVTFIDWPAWQLEQRVQLLRRPLAGSPPVTIGRATYALGPQHATVTLRMPVTLKSPSLLQRVF